ncbi:MAG TPA: ABC transporter permease [Gemmatimonadaceae bacterium]|nr:ABC transporter permease [Gemmatimonadaceae bacterium]
MLARLRDLLRRSGAPSDEEIARELRDHIEFEAQARAGEPDPYGAAHRAFGNVSRTAEAVHTLWHPAWIEQSVQDLRLAWRSLRRTPTYALAVCITLALGIGAATAVYSMVEGVFTSPYPLLPQDQLLWIAERTPRCSDCYEGSPAALVALRQHVPALSSVAAASPWSGAFRTTGGSEMTSGFRVTANLFAIIDAPFALGHGFPEGADAPGAPGAAVLSYDFWRSRLAASSGALDSTITLGGRPVTVVGVLARDVAFPEAADVYLPYPVSAQAANDFESRSLVLVGRLAPGATMQAVAAQAKGVARQLARQSPRTNATWTLVPRPMREYHTDDVKGLRTIAVASAILVLLAACMSAANLLVARLSTRRPELALRAALGVRRWRLARHLLAESLVLALVAGAVGVMLAHWGVSALHDMVPVTLARFIPGWAHLRVDGRVLLFTLAVSIASMAGFALVPVVGATRVDVQSVLGDASRSSTAGVHGVRLRSVLVVLEVTVALVLITASTLLTRSIHNIVAADPGVRRDHVLTMNLMLRGGLTDSAMRDVYRRVDAALGAQPDVLSAGFISTLPLSNSSWGTSFEIPGRPPAPDGRPLTALDQRVSPGYADAAGIRIVSGRWITAADTADGERVAVVSTLLADRMWPGAPVIGRVLVVDGVPWHIVGVVANVYYGGLDEPLRPTIYRPVLQAPSGESAIAVWTRGDPDAARDVVRRVVAGVDPDAAIGEVMSMRALESRHISGYRVMAALVTVLAFVTLLIAIVGLSGLVAYGVSQRTREFGVRLALGARASDILAHVAGGALRLAALGIAAGAVGALAFARLLTALLYGVGPGDPITLAAASAALFVVALAAALVPAFRAAGVDPASTLRE